MNLLIYHITVPWDRFFAFKFRLDSVWFASKFWEHLLEKKTLLGKVDARSTALPREAVYKCRNITYTGRTWGSSQGHHRRLGWSICVSETQLIIITGEITLNYPESYKSKLVLTSLTAYFWWCKILRPAINKKECAAFYAAGFSIGHVNPKASFKSQS